VTSDDNASDEDDVKQCADKVSEVISLAFGGRLCKTTNLILDSREVSVKTTQDMSRLSPEQKYTAMCQTKAVSVFCVVTSREMVS
jgi:hypothetical protein